MKTRSGQTYELKCVCKKWYPNQEESWLMLKNNRG